MEREMKEKIFHLSQILHCYHTNDSLTQAKTDTCMYTHKHTNTHVHTHKYAEWPIHVHDVSKHTH